MRKIAALLAMLTCASALALPPERHRCGADAPVCAGRRACPTCTDWRPAALRSLRIAIGDVIERPATFALYRDAGLNTITVFDADTCDAANRTWNYKTEEQIRSVTTFARVNGMPLIIGLAIEPFGSIPQASDELLRGRLALWKSYGDDVILAVSPWYDDVFYERVGVDRQRHVYEVIKDAAPEWYVFGIIGEFGFDAGEEEIARYYDPAAFDHVAVLMYPYNIGAQLTGFVLDNIASPDPDGDLERYIDRFIERMDEKFFRRMQTGQQLLLVVQAFHYPGDPAGRIPRGDDVRIMADHGNEMVRALDGQQANASIGYCCWGAEQSRQLTGLADRSDWIIAARDTDQRIARRMR